MQGSSVLNEEIAEKQYVPAITTHESRAGSGWELTEKETDSMAGKKIFCSDKAPVPKGPYSQAVIHDGLMYISGQIPVDPLSGEMVRATIEEETDTVLSNIRIIVEEAGAKMENVLKVTCYLADIEDFPRFNAVFEKHFAKSPPARSTIQAGKLPMDVQVEMDAIVALPVKKRRYPHTTNSRHSKKK